MNVGKYVAVAAAGALLCIGAGCDFPRDANHTQDRIEGGVIRVGAVENPPWVRRSAGGASGVEATLVDEFAQRHHARVEWIWGTESAHLQALENDDLDMVVGGLTDKSPWSEQVAMTRPYYKETIAVGVPPAMPAPRQIDHLHVAAERGSAVVHDLEGKHAVPVTIPGLINMRTPPSGLAVAAPIWRLKQWGLGPTDTTLDEQGHVVALPPGENGWLMEWEKFLDSERAHVPSLLDQEKVAAQ